MATPRASLPELVESQASKEITHNAALRMIEALTIGGVISRTVSTPPGSPNEGETWIVGSGATGAWAGKENQIAHYNNGAWAFYQPAQGWSVHINSESRRRYFTGTTWSTYQNEANSVQASLAAAGNSAATAAAATSDLVEVVSSTVGSADGVRLRAIALGRFQVIFNKTPNSINVYPPSGQQINYAGVDVPHVLPAWSTTTYYAVKSNSYYT